MQKLTYSKLFCLLSFLCFSFHAFSEQESVEQQKYQKYKIDSQASHIHIYTGSSGFLKSVSHDHLVAIKDIQGNIILDGKQSLARLSFQPINFLVDDDTERAKAVDEKFRDKVANWVKKGTKKNMLGHKVLDAGLYPDISVEVRSADFKTELTSGEHKELLLLAAVKFKGSTYNLKVPAILSANEETLTASGDFRLSHSDLGLKQFSVPGGLSKVADSLRFQFQIRALPSITTFNQQSVSYQN